MGVVVTDKALQLVDQLSGFLRSDEFGGLDQIYQKLYLRQFKFAAQQPVTIAGTITVNDIKTIVTKSLDIAVNAFALRLDSVCGKMRDDLCGCYTVEFIGMVPQIIQNL